MAKIPHEHPKSAAHMNVVMPRPGIESFMDGAELRDAISCHADYCRLHGFPAHDYVVTLRVTGPDGREASFSPERIQVSAYSEEGARFAATRSDSEWVLTVLDVLCCGEWSKSA